MSDFVLGVDLGGTKIHAAIAASSGEIVAEARVPTHATDAEAVLAQIAGLATRLRDEAGLPGVALRHAAVGCPGIVSPGVGHVRFAPNIDGFDRVDVQASLGALLRTEVSLDNDANLAAMGEHWRGACVGLHDFVFVALGTGIGMGVMAGGRLLRGARGGAGEIARLPIGADPFDRDVAVVGALEHAIGSVGILSRYRRLGGDPAADLRHVFDSVGCEGAALAAVDGTARLLAQALIAVSAVIEPQVVAMGGSIGVRPELVTRVRHWLERGMQDPMPLVATTLSGRATLYGAIAMALAAS